MKILCVIDHFGSGGAQRQMVNLAGGLKSRGHSVEMFVYQPEFDFFRHEVETDGIGVYEAKKGAGFSAGVLWKLVKRFWAQDYDVVVSFLDSPNVYTALAGLVTPRMATVVSERSSYLTTKSSWIARTARLALWGTCSAVVANSVTQADWLRRRSSLAKRVRVIYNGFRISPFSDDLDGARIGAGLLVVGRVGPEKNGIRLIDGLDLFWREHGFVPKVSWAGNVDSSESGLAYRSALEQRLSALPHVAQQWEWLGERRDVPELLGTCEALVHPSVYEGLPNVVCEAMVAGRPVLVSNVCDHPRLVQDGQRGFLFDPLDPVSIAAALSKFFRLSPAEKSEMGIRAKRYAVEHLNLARMIATYEDLLFEVSARRR